MKKEQKLNDDGILIDLPIQDCSAISHILNVKYCLGILKEYSQITIPVIGYIKERSITTRLVDYRVISLERAIELKKTHDNFEYKTLDEFIKKEQDIKNGRYILNDGALIALNPIYR